jgi:hypothetical protein
MLFVWNIAWRNKKLLCICLQHEETNQNHILFSRFKLLLVNYGYDLTKFFFSLGEEGGVLGMRNKEIEDNYEECNSPIWFIFWLHGVLNVRDHSNGCKNPM